MMKKVLVLLVLITTVTTGFSQKTYDTIRVHNRTHLSTKGEYTKKVLFPIKNENINYVGLDLYLNCPDSGCSDWDYSISVLLRTVKNNDTTTFQLGRMITPYSGSYNQGKNAKKWNEKWHWNITEYLPLLKDSVDIVVVYEGYQDGFLASTDFVFEKSNDKREKTPKLLGVENVHYGYFPYGKEKDPIDNYVKEKEITLPKGTKSVWARVTISGHGGDSLNAAAEFLKKNYYYKVNGEEIAKQAIWKDDCGCNKIQPQGGTWIYNRAGWCPGTKVNEYYYNLTPYIKDNKLKVDIDFDYYNGYSSGDAGYQVANDLFFIGEKGYKVKAYNIPIQKSVKSVVELPKDITLVFKTNNDARDKFFVKDNEGNPIFERSQIEPNTEYSQKLSLQENKWYNLVVEDNDCDGLSWWANKEQGDGYVLIYNEDKTKLLEAFDPDFGCKIDYDFKTVSKNNKDTAQFIHKDYKLVTLNNEKDSTLRVILFTPYNKEEDLTLYIQNRKTKDTVLTKTYTKNSTFDIPLNYSSIEKGVYWVKISCGDFSDQRLLVIKGKEEDKK
jgi:hypothetical protein